MSDNTHGNMQSHDARESHVGHAVRSITLAVCLLSACAVMSVPSAAFADDGTSDVMQQARSIRFQISSAQSDYIDAVQQESDIEAQLSQAQGQLDAINARYSDSQAALAKLVKSEYAYSPMAKVTEAMTGSGDISSILTTVSCCNKLESDKATMVSDIADLKSQQETAMSDLSSKSAEAKERSDEAQGRKDDLDGQLSALKPQIDAISSELSTEIQTTSSSTEEMQSLLDYMTNIYDITDTQESLIRSAYSTGYSGSSLCENWVERVYRNAGVDISSYGSAWLDYSDNCRSSDPSEIRAGALVYGSGSNQTYNHVGIAVTDALGDNGEDTLILDNEGSRTGKAVTLKEWVSWQTNVSYNNGRSGFFGWGYPDGTEL